MGAYQLQGYNDNSQDDANSETDRDVGVAHNRLQMAEQASGNSVEQATTSWTTIHQGIE